jgi:eukaryotic-like serine/threonine-protein kinase
MAITIGTRLGAYEIVGLLGQGGMGEVYRATDTRLNRAVAIKVLAPHLAGRGEMKQRFEREAQTIAGLNHPNIAALHNFEESAGELFLVMELVEGETLADRIRRGPLPAREALQFAQQIAEAVEAAHEKGIVHRDLKPANIKITPDGKVKVLDFGLAKVLETAPATANSNSPTLSLAATNAGVILGTAAYMSPEQAKGLAADTESDVFSFGCILYEMLSGRQAFHADTVPEILAAVLMREPDWGALPANLHPRIHEILRRCLDKNRRERWRAMADVRIEIQRILADPQGATSRAGNYREREPLWKRAVPIAVAVALTCVITVAAVWNLRPSVPSTSVTRFSFVLPDGQTL